MGSDHVSLPRKTGSDGSAVKMTRMTLSRHSEARGFMPLLKTGEIYRRLGQEICHARMQNQRLVFGIGLFGSKHAVVSRSIALAACRSGVPKPSVNWL
jgi:hypothetical protein